MPVKSSGTRPGETRAFPPCVSRAANADTRATYAQDEREHQMVDEI